VAWHAEDLLEIHPVDAEDRGIRSGDKVSVKSRAGETALRATVTERVQPGVVYTTFHFPESGANVVTTNNSDWATNCPEYKVTAVQIQRVTSESAWQNRWNRFHDIQQRLLQGETVPAEDLAQADHSHQHEPDEAVAKV
jgi:formate dehydrogenase major subunit